MISGFIDSTDSLSVDTKSKFTVCGHCGYRYIKNTFFAEEFILSESEIAKFLSKLFKKGYKFNLINCNFNKLYLNFEEGAIFSLKDLGNVKNIFRVKETKDSELGTHNVEIEIPDIWYEENKKIFSDWIDSLPYIQMK